MELSHNLQFLLAFAIILLAAKGSGILFSWIRLPFITGEILAGVILGPTIFNILSLPIFARPDSGPLLSTITDMSEIAILLLLFLAGLETDKTQLKRVGTTSLMGATGGVILPFGGGIALGLLFGFSLITSMFIGAVLTATSVTITARLLLERGLQATRTGTAIMGAAIIDDVLGILILSLTIAFSSGGSFEDAVAFPLIRLVIWIVLAYILGKLLIPPLLRFANAIPQNGIVLAVALVVMFVFAVSAELGGKVATITGAYLAGFLIGQTPYKEKVTRGINPLTYSFFLPIFFVSIGLRADLKQVFSEGWLFALILTLWAIASKIVGVWFGAYITRFGGRNSLRLGCGMVGRGEVGFIIGSYGLSAGIISENVFAGAVMMVFVTTLFAPSLLHWAFGAGKGEVVEAPSASLQGEEMPSEAVEKNSG